MAIRVEGVAALEEIEAVVLETDGSFSVMKKSANDSRTSLTDVFCFGVLQIRRCLKK